MASHSTVIPWHSAGRVILFGTTHRVGAKEQVVIPKDLRDRLGIVPGDEVEFTLEEGGDAVRLELVRDRPKLRGSLAGLGLVAELEAEHRSEARR
jgi:AbrB family looped-hinge helix DNA binding protein